MNSPSTPFPDSFIWGAAGSAAQMEGRWAANGETAPSIWDHFSELPGKIQGGDTPRLCCDFRRRYREDIERMRYIGLKAFRFSVSWARLQPEGKGPLVEVEIAYYSDLVDALMEAGIEPVICLSHWEIPHHFQDTGLWLNPALPRLFADFAGKVVEALSDRVTQWLTMNEPVEFANAFLSPNRAPEGVGKIEEAWTVIKHVLLGHGLCVQAIREKAVRTPIISVANVCDSYFPATHSPEDLAAAKRANFEVWPGNRLASYGIWTDAMYRGRFDPSVEKAYGEMLPPISAEEWGIIGSPIDYLGVNCYFGVAVRAGREGEPIKVPQPTSAPRTSMNWPLTPEALYWVPKMLHGRYGCRMVITENGMSNTDWVALDGRVHDPQRIDFFRRHFQCLAEALAEGAPIDGLFAWTLLDNFEWQLGFSQRFGLIHVNHQTQKRTLKDSAYFLRDVIANPALIGQRIDASEG